MQWKIPKKRPWSKLQKELGIQIHCTVYPIREGRKGKGNKRGMSRWWITMDKEIIWDTKDLNPKDYEPYTGWSKEYNERK